MGTITAPFAASGPREPTQRPRQIPQAVRAAALQMIYEGCDLVVAAEASGLRVDTLRRWLHRPELVSLIRRERAAFRQAICSGNELALKKVRDGSPNAMAVFRALDQLQGDDGGRADGVSPGITLRIIAAPQPAQPIDVTPKPRIIDADEQ